MPSVQHYLDLGHLRRLECVRVPALPADSQSSADTPPAPPATVSTSTRPSTSRSSRGSSCGTGGTGRRPSCRHGLRPTPSPSSALRPSSSTLRASRSCARRSRGARAQGCGRAVRPASSSTRCALLLPSPSRRASRQEQRADAVDLADDGRHRRQAGASDRHLVAHGRALRPRLRRAQQCVHVSLLSSSHRTLLTLSRSSSERPHPGFGTRPRQVAALAPLHRHRLLVLLRLDLGGVPHRHALSRLRQRVRSSLSRAHDEAAGASSSSEGDEVLHDLEQAR